MAPLAYDTDALTQFVHDHDLYGLRQATPPPVELRKADQVRREPNAPGQWAAAMATFLGSPFIGAMAVAIYLVVTVGSFDQTGLQKLLAIASLVQEKNWLIAIIFLSVNPISAAVLYWVFVRLIARRPVYELSGPGWFKEFGAGLLLGVVLISVIVGVLFGMGHYKVEGIQFTKSILVALFIGISPAFAEEVVFRGFLLRLLDKALGSIPAIVITSLLFGLVHAGNPHVSLLQSVLLGISAGLLLGSCYYLTRRLWLAIGLHLTWNFVQGGIYNSDVSGTGYYGGLLKATFDGPEWITGGKMGIEGSVISIGLTIAVGLIFLIVAYRRGNLNGRIGWNAPRINLLGSVPRLEIWAADGGWRPLPTAEELEAMMAPIEDEDLDLQGDTEAVPTAPGEPPATGPTQTGSALITESANDPFDPDIDDEVDALLPPEDAALTGEVPVSSASGLKESESEPQISPEDKTEQFAPVTLDSAPTITPEPVEPNPDWPSDAEMDAVTAKAPGGPPTITKVSSSVTTVKGTGTGSLTDDDLDSTQQMDAVAEIEMTDQIKPINQTKITEDKHE